MSANIGLAPARRTVFAVAMKVKDGTITSSPALILCATMAACSAVVPELKTTACFVPMYSAIFFSNSTVSGPHVQYIPLLTILVTAETSSLSQYILNSGIFHKILSNLLSASDSSGDFCRYAEGYYIGWNIAVHEAECSNCGVFAYGDSGHYDAVGADLAVFL